LDDYWTPVFINRFFKKGYVHFDGLCDSQLELKTRIPQGSIISPLMCNILLHELDCYIEKYIQKYSNYTIRVKNVSKNYTKIRSYISND
jgi:retron-type reverse transcriptase